MELRLTILPHKNRFHHLSLFIPLLIISVNCSRAQVETDNVTKEDLPFEIVGNEVFFTRSSIFGPRGTRTKRLKPKDIKSFEWIDGAFSKDKYFVYYTNKILSSADPQSFTCLSKIDDYHELDAFPSLKGAIGLDKNSLFIMPTSNLFLDSIIHGEEVIPRKDFKIVKVMDDLNGVFLVQSGRDMYELRGDMFYMTPEIRKYPFKSNEYKILGGCFIQSGHKIYDGTLLMEDVVPSKFKTFGNSAYYAHDGIVYFNNGYMTKKVEGADAHSFEVHSVINFLARDNKRSFFFDQEADSVQGYPASDYFNGKVSREEMEQLKDDFRKH